MKIPLAILALSALLLCHPGMALAGPRVPATCVAAVDGDTLRVRVAGLLVDVRLLGVDAPEKSQEWGPQAKAFAAAWCGPGRDLGLELDREERDRFRRTLAYAWADGRMLNLELVRAGLALPYPFKPNLAHAQEMEAAQAEARAARSGFWNAGGLAMSPAEWRRTNR